MERYEQRAGDTCFGIWQPETVGMPFVAQKGNPWPLRCDDVAETRAALEAKGVEFYGETFDTGVCHMAIFADPDGNELMLHRRYAPAEVTHQVAAVVVDDLARPCPSRQRARGRGPVPDARAVRRSLRVAWLGLTHGGVDTAGPSNSALRSPTR